MASLFKIFSLFVRVFARPVIYYTKQIHLGDKEKINKYVKIWFIYLGNKYNKLEAKINRRFLKLESKDEFFLKPLKDEQAIEKGVEIFYEVIIYSLMIGFPLYELSHTYRQSVAESRRRDDKIQEMENEIRELKMYRDQSQFLLKSHIKEQELMFEEIKQLVQRIRQDNMQLQWNQSKGIQNTVIEGDRDELFKQSPQNDQ